MSASRAETTFFSWEYEPKGLFLSILRVTQVNLTYPVSRLGNRRERMGQLETRHLRHVVGVLLAEHGKLPQECEG
jgi:hypothetical protein